MRTAQSLPSTTTRRPVAKRRAVDEQVDRLVRRPGVELDHRARGGAPPRRRSACWPRPSSAQTRTGMPASDGAPRSTTPAPAADRAAGAGAEARRRSSSSALDIRTTNAFGNELDEPRRLAADRHRRPHRVRRGRVGVGDLVGRREALGLRRRDLDLGPRHHRGRRGGRGHHLVHRLRDRGQLELGHSVERPDPQLSPYPSSRRPAAGRPRA